VNTENVAILFTDIVGSTELSQRMSAEVADEVRRAHFSILRQAITESGGREVKNLGDGLMVAFGSASSALSCAVAMQQGVDVDNRRLGTSVGLRVGLSGGETTREDDDYFGDPVVQASRLCDRCERGQILAAEVVRLMAGRHNRHGSRSVGSLVLKGLPDPVEVVEIPWEPVTRGAVDGAIPMPGRIALAPAVGFIGRVRELGTLEEAWRRTALDGSKEIHLVHGEAGQGKTTLVGEAARRAFGLGSCVLFGHAEEDLASPYQLFAEALGHYVTHAPEDRLLSHIAVHGSELSRIVPALESRITELPPTRASDSESERFLLFAAVLGLLADASSDHPITLVLEDLQWADKGSLLLLQHLASNDPSMRVLVLGTYRDSEPTVAHPFVEFLARLRRQPCVSRTTLVGLDDGEVATIMEAAAGCSLSEAERELARAIHRETDGNPFFVTELLRHLSESGAIRQDPAGRWVTAGGLDELSIPQSLREVIDARIGRLGPQARSVLTVAAVIGRDFDTGLLERATGMEEDGLLDLLDAAAAASLVREYSDTSGRYSFAHALVQHAVYQDIGSRRRARIHRVVAQSLEDLLGDRPGIRIGELARHWSSTGDAGDSAKAVHYASAAGQAALTSLAPGDALRHFTEAAAIADRAGLVDPVSAIDVAIGLGTAQRQTGDPAFRESLLDAAHRAAELGDIDRLVAATLANDRGWASASGKVDFDKVSLLELALDRLGTNHPARPLVLATLCAELEFGSTLAHRQALADEALQAVGTLGDDATVAKVLNHLVFPLLVPSLLAQSLAWSQEALTRAERAGDPLLRYFAAAYRATVATRAGDIDEVDRCYAEAASLVQQLNQPSLRWEYTFHLAKRAQIAGDTVEAERLATEAFGIGVECGQPDAETFFGVQLAAVSWQRGTMGDLAPLIEQMVAESPGLPTLKASLAIAYSQAERTDDARRLLLEFAAEGFSLPQDSAWLNGMTEYAEAAIACGDQEFAGPLFDRLAPFSDQFSSAGGVTAEGPVSNVLGGLATVLGRFDEAECYFVTAAAFSARFAATYFGTETDLLWGQMLVARHADDDIDRARALLERARTTAETFGYGGIERRATAVLQHLE